MVEIRAACAGIAGADEGFICVCWRSEEFAPTLRDALTASQTVKQAREVLGLSLSGAVFKRVVRVCSRLEPHVT